MADVLPFPASEASFEAGLSDGAARAQALDIRMSCIVEAPAGSGKTGLLMQRYLKLLGEAELAQPEEVLAITFTNKATAELRQRVLEQLEAAHNNHPAMKELPAFQQSTRAFALAALSRSEELGWDLLHRPQRLNIRTIDSVCAEIAHALPLLSGSAAARRPTTDTEPLYRMAAQRTMLQLGGRDETLHHALRTVLLHRDASLSDCETLLARMLEARDQWAELVPLGAELQDSLVLDHEVRPRLERTLRRIVCDGLSRASRAMPHGMLRQLTLLAAQLGLNPGYKDEPSPIALCAERTTPPAEEAEHLDHWRALIYLLLKQDGDWRKSFNKDVMKFEMNRQEKATLKWLIDEYKSDSLCAALNAVRDLPPAHYPDDQWHVAKALFIVLRHALAELKVLFAESEECDFTEISLAARDALLAAPDDSDATDLALAAGGRLRHLLVDEMQDTSANQYELIQQLTRSWDGHTQTLFLVGDPKQSIYLFRQARVERFLRTMQEQQLGDVRLQALYLTTNFRSQAALVEDFNYTFHLLFPSREEAAQQNSDAVDVPFVAATADRAATDTAAVVWHPAILRDHNTAPGGLTPSQEHELEQASLIRIAIEHWLAKPLPQGRTKPWRIAVLARVRSHFAPIVSMLKQANIPYRAIDIDPLAERQEVLDVLALTRALVHPSNRTAWLALLRAPWCGLSLADLLMLTGQGEDNDEHEPVTRLVATRGRLLSNEGRQLLERIWPVLRAALEAGGTSPLSVQVERTWRSLGGDAALDSAARTNVSRYLDVLRSLEDEGGPVAIPALQRRLQSLFAEPMPGNPPVELLTIHKAKGLEWDVVFVPSLERLAGSSGNELLRWLELDSSAAPSIILAPINGKGQESTQLTEWLKRIQSAREDTERRRLFYVACTRAAEELHLFAACKRKTDGGLATPAHGSLLRSCWPAAEEHFATLQDQGMQVSAPEPFEPMDEELGTLALAASAAPQPAIIQRLPVTFHPLERFAEAFERRVSYTPAAALPHAPTFDRPEGSFAVRAFGNVVHRYLQLLATYLEHTFAAVVLAELPRWEQRLAASLRGEGLSPVQAEREAKRALQALEQTLRDETGCWILSPHEQAASERELTTVERRSLRVDRTFLSGPQPGSTGGSHIWIIDFKTTELGHRSLSDFTLAELAKYRPQLEAYAAQRRGLPDGHLPIRLGLYYPLVPHLIEWHAPATSPDAASSKL